MLENVCNENNRDTAHLVGSANIGVQVSPAVLAKYVGTYQYREGPTNIAGFIGKTQNVTMINGQLYLNALPLIPQSQMKFESTGAITEFFMDANGKVTHLVLGLTEGAARYDRKP